MLHGETLEQCLERFPAHAAELRPLLETAMVLRRAASFQPRPEFREEARHRFQRELLGMASRTRQPSPRQFRRPRWAMVMAVILAVLMAGGGTVAASNASMPDQPLYPVKMAVERTWLALTPSSLGKAELYAMLTERRITEITRMVDEGKPEKVEEVSKRVDVILMQVEALSSEGKGQADQKMIVIFSTEQNLDAPGAAPPQAPRPDVTPPPFGRYSAIERRAQDEPEEGEIKFDRRAQLKARIRHYAVNHPARLRALLKDAPDSALPALFRAIAVTESGYDRALRSLDEN